MTYRGNIPPRERLMMERRRKQTRRSAARLTAFALLLSALLVLILATALVLVWISRKASTKQPADKGIPAAKVELGIAKRIRPAPWFLSLDSSRLYIGQGPAKLPADTSGFPLNKLSAITLANGKVSWETELDGRHSDLQLCGQALVSLQENAGSDAGVSLQAFWTRNGDPSWEVNIPGASDASLAYSNAVVCLVWHEPPVESEDKGWRVAGFDARSGKQLWRVKLRLRELVDADTAEAEAQAHAWPGVCGFTLGNAAGLLSAKSGKVLSAFTASGPVGNLQYDPVSQAGFLVCPGSRPSEFIIEVLPVGSRESPYSLVRIDTAGNAVLMLSSAGWIAAAYESRSESGIVPKFIACRSGDRKPRYSTVFENGTPVDLAALAGRAGEFLLALNEGGAGSLGATGPSSIRRIRVEGESTAWEAARYKQPVHLLNPFLKDCLVLTGSGQVMLYEPASDSSRRLCMLGLEEMGAITALDGSAVALTAYPKDYLQGRAGLTMRLQVVH